MTKRWNKLGMYDKLYVVLFLYKWLCHPYWIYSSLLLCLHSWFTFLCPIHWSHHKRCDLIEPCVRLFNALCLEMLDIGSDFCCTRPRNWDPEDTKCSLYRGGGLSRNIESALVFSFLHRASDIRHQSFWSASWNTWTQFSSKKAKMSSKIDDFIESKWHTN